MSTNFFDRQEMARRNTVRLLSLLSLVMVFLIAGSYLLLMLCVDLIALVAGIEDFVLLGALFDEEKSFVFHPELLLWAVAGTVLIIGGGAFVKSRTLAQGGSAVAEALGGVPASASSPDALVRRFVNVVEEMSLASGVPVPRIYVLEKQRGINAFAAGYTINDAAIAVTRGALRHLNRDELQAVVAHEFSHILHGDMKLNIYLIGILHGILGFYQTGLSLNETALRSLGTTQTSGGRADYSPILLILLIPGSILMLMGFGGLLGSRLIKAGVARQREYLADASAVQYTRNPRALVDALKKIGGFAHGSRLVGAQAEMVSHMCFGEASSSWFTHPPVEERVLALDPQFNPDHGFRVIRDVDADPGLANLKLAAPGKDDARSISSSQIATLGADELIGAIGQTSAEQLIYCATLLQRIPEPIVEARSTLAGAVATAYLLLLDEDRQVRRTQAELIQDQAPSSIAREAQKLWPVLRDMDDELRLPLMDLLIPVLRQMTDEQFEQFRRVASALIETDSGTGFRAFIMERVVLHHLEIAFGTDPRRSTQFTSFSGVTRDLEHVLSALAFAASDDIAIVESSFAAGRNQLPRIVADKLELRPRDRWSFDHIATSLERLSLSTPNIKRAVIDACAHCVMVDERLVTSEIEMLRAICEILDVPLPPLIIKPTIERSEAGSSSNCEDVEMA